METVDDRMDGFDRGVRNRRAVLGDAWVDQSLHHANEFNAEFQSLITRYAWNDIWGRPGLDHTTRRLLVLGMTMGLARWEEFELHCGASIRGGVPLAMIKETLIRMRVQPPRSRGGRKAPCVHLGAHTNELGLTHERSDL